MAARDQHAQVRVAAQRARQVAAGARVAVALGIAAVPVPLLVYLHRQDLVALRRHHAELVAHVAERGHRVGRLDRLDAGIEFPVAGAARRHRAGDPRVEAADDLALVAQQLEEEVLVTHAQVLLGDEGGREAGQLADAPGDAVARLAFELRAAVQGAQVVFLDEGFGRLAGRGGRCRGRALELAVVLRDAGEGGQEEGERQVVARRKDDALQVHRA